MLRDTPRRAPGHRFIGRLASIFAAGLFLMPTGCKFTMPMDRYLLNSPPVPGPLSSGWTPPLNVTRPPGSEADDSGVKPVSYRTSTPETPSPIPDPLPPLSSGERVRRRLPRETRENPKREEEIPLCRNACRRSVARTAGCGWP